MGTMGTMGTMGMDHGIAAKWRFHGNSWEWNGNFMGQHNLEV